MEVGRGGGEFNLGNLGVTHYVTLHSSPPYSLTFLRPHELLMRQFD